MFGAAKKVDVAIIGAGFAGIAMAAKLKRAGQESFAVLERGTDVGGTWRDNTYPGCGCDVPSHVYSFSFAPNPEWSRTYAAQGEIHAYLRKVASKEGLVPHIRLGCEVQDASWDTGSQRWRIRTSSGELTARALVTAAGPFSETKLPDVKGLEGFTGKVFHSATWDHDYDLKDKRVAVIGTGASSIQFVPEIQPEVSRLHLFQRTAPWIVPRTARPISNFERRVYRRAPGLQRAMRSLISLSREVMAIPMIRVRLAWITRLLCARHLRRQVPDRALRRKLTPDYAPGCKRILISNKYYPALAQPNVEVIAGGLTEVREGSVLSAEGTEREVDTIIFGTGFNVTEPPIARRIKGRDGRSLSETWAEIGMQAHRGTTVVGFPNLFMLLGPNTGLGHNSVMLMAEAQVDYALQAIQSLDCTGSESVEPLPHAQARWNADIQRREQGTVWVDGGCASWYLDRGRNTTVWPGFTFAFRRELRRFDTAEYAVVAPQPAESRVTA